MKSILKVLGFLVLSTFIFTACSKDTDPANVDLFAGTYKGTTAYTSDAKTVASGQGSVFVTKAGTKYRFTFDRGIPDFGEDFEKKDDGTFVSVGTNGFTGIKISANKLTMLVTKNGATWTANCDR